MTRGRRGPRRNGPPRGPRRGAAARRAYPPRPAPARARTPDLSLSAVCRHDHCAICRYPVNIVIDSAHVFARKVVPRRQRRFEQPGAAAASRLRRRHRAPRTWRELRDIDTFGDRARERRPPLHASGHAAVGRRYRRGSTCRRPPPPTIARRRSRRPTFSSPSAGGIVRAVAPLPLEHGAPNISRVRDLERWERATRAVDLETGAVTARIDFSIARGDPSRQTLSSADSAKTLAHSACGTALVSS